MREGHPDLPPNTAVPLRKGDRPEPSRRRPGGAGANGILTERPHFRDNPRGRGAHNGTFVVATTIARPMRRLYRPLALAALVLAGLPPGPAALAQVPSGGPPAGAVARQGGVVAGRVVADATGEALEFATVALYRLPDSTLATGNLADEEGRFRFEGLRPGRYYLSVSIVGYAARRVPVDLTPAALTRDVGDVRLGASDRALDEVTVEGERPDVQVEVDRTSYTVADQATSSGGTASDVLQKVPQVDVDADGNVSLRGSDNVAILINGRPAPVPRQFLATFLRQLPADQIERVEVIPNPSARFDPDGLAGMLNIVLKSNQRRALGVSGGVQLGGSTLGEANTSANVNLTGKALTAYASYGLRRDVRQFSGDTDRRSLSASGATLNALDQLDDGDFGGLGHVFNTTLDYTLSRTQSLAFQGLASYRASDRDNRTTYRYTGVGSDNQRLADYDRVTEASGTGLNADATLTYRNVTTPSRHEFTAEARFGLNRDDDASTILQRFLDDAANPTGTPFTETSASDNDRRDGTLQADYVRPLFGEKGKVEAGYKGTLRRLDANQDALRYVDSVAVEQDDAFVYDENVQAAYLSVARQFGKVGVQAGLRAEQVWTTFDGALVSASDNDYFSLFPSAFVTYAPDVQNQFRASYSRRIDRADARQLNPVVRIDDPITRQAGNPLLRPSYTNSFDLSYSRFSNLGFVSVNPFYRRATDVVQRVTRADPADPEVTVVTFDNVASRDDAGVGLNGSIRTPSFSFGGGVTGQYFRSEGTLDGLAVDVSGFGWNARLNGEWTMRPGSTASGFLFYSPPRVTEQGRFGGFSRMTFAFRQKLLGERATATIQAQDPFNISRFSFESSGPGYALDSVRRFQARALTLTLAYTFGQQPQNRRPNQQRRPQEQAPQAEPDPFGQGGGR